MSDAGSDTEGREEGPILGVYYYSQDLRFIQEIAMEIKKDMVRGRMYSLMEISMQDLIHKEKDLDLVSINGRMDIDTLEIIQKIKEMEKELLFILMDPDMKGISRLENVLDKENIFMLMVIITLDNGKMIRNMDKVCNKDLIFRRIYLCWIR